VGAIYRQPNQSIEVFKELLEKILQKISAGNIPGIINW
jgi:hypothetical protein